MKLWKLGIAGIILLLTACTVPIKNIDPTSFNVDKGQKEPIPNVCKTMYESVVPKVAVANFANNTTFDYATVVQQNVTGSGQRTAVGGAAVGVAPGAAGVVWGSREKSQFQRDSQTTSRNINAKLSESVEDGVMNELVNLGGVKVFTRTDLDKIMSEQKFQQSGLVDDSSLVQLGRMAGVRYIITGSVNNVDLSYKTYGAVKHNRAQGDDNLAVSLLGSMTAAVAESQEGWNINADIAVRLLDVESGEILVSQVVTGKHIIGKVPYPNYDAFIGGMKKAASKGIEDLRPKFSKYFTMKGYIIQTRSAPDGSERVALVNIGEKQGLKPYDQLFVYTFQEVTDPLDETKISCDMMKLPVLLRITNQLQGEKAWTLMDGAPDSIKRVRVGQLVERVPLTGQGFMKNMGY